MAARAPCEGVVHLGEVREEEVRHPVDRLESGRRRRTLLRLDRRPIQVSRRDVRDPAVHATRKPQQVVQAESRTRRTTDERGTDAAGRSRRGQAREGRRTLGLGDDSPATAQVPDDLAKELAKSAKAKKFFDSLSSANRYAILYRLQEAKKPETRARRLAKFVEMLEKGEKLHP